MLFPGFSTPGYDAQQLVMKSSTIFTLVFYLLLLLHTENTTFINMICNYHVLM